MGILQEVSTYSFWILFFQTLALGAGGAYIYFFGIPASFKRYLQDEAIENLGEGTAKQYLKQGLDKIPDSDKPEVQKLRSDMKAKIPSSVGDISNSLGSLGGGKKE